MKITDGALVAEVRRLAAERPDFVYEKPHERQVGGPECFYVHTTEDGEKVGGCLLGQALINLGVPVDVMETFDGVENGAADDVLPDFGISEQVAAWAGWAQHMQDTGQCWSVAVEEADEKVKLNGV